MYAKNNRKTATQGECSSYKPRVLPCLPLIDHLIQETNDRLLSQEDCFLGQCLLPTKLQGLRNDVQDKMYAAYTNNLTDMREYARTTRCCSGKQSGCIQLENEPATLADTLDYMNPTLYRNVNTILTIRHTIPVSTMKHDA